MKGFTGNPLDRQRFIQDAKIRFDYFRHCKLTDMDKVSLIIALLEDDAKVWYNSIHVHISEEAAQRAGVPFNKDNELRTWTGFPKRLEGNFGGHSDRDRALNQWEVFKMKPYKVDPFCDELIRLASVLNYYEVHVKDKARISMTAELCRAWALKTPHSESYIDYINLLRQTGHLLEDVVSFNQHLVKEKSTSQQERGDDKRSKPRDKKKRDKAQGPRNPKPQYFSSSCVSKPFQSEYAIKYKDIPQTLTDKRKLLSQCTRCGVADHFWLKCSAPQPVVMFSKPGPKLKAEIAELKHTKIPKTRRIEAAPVVNKVGTTEVRRTPPILEVDTDPSDSR